MTHVAANRRDLTMRLCRDVDTARQLSRAGAAVCQEGAIMAAWTTTRLNLRYHWKAVLGWSLGILIVGSTLVALASIERPDCRWNWDEEWYHHRTTVGQVRWCLSGNHVDIN